MNDRIWWRLAATSGILYVALGVAHSSGGGGIGFGDSRETIAGWVGSTLGARGVNWIGVYSGILGLLCLVVFSAILAAAIRHRVGPQTWLSSLTFGAGLLAVAVKLTSLPAAFALAYRAHEGFEPQLAAALTDMNDFSFVLTWPLFALMIGTAAIGILRYASLPAWLGWSGVAAAVALFAALPLAFGPGAFIAFITSSVWIVLASATMIVRPTPAAQPALPREAALAAS
ncbi:MAG TPA: hypothetical protein VGZ22_17330 [Isosphaeraceae bacterium]|nr:hypothetical protein [Isosphaeraceae bacterium]